jgi:hypothetical protein
LPAGSSSTSGQGTPSAVLSGRGRGFRHDGIVR